MRGCRKAALLVLLAAAAMPAAADWKDDYARGLEAARDGRWGEVSRYMDSAIAGNAQPAPRLRLYGQRYEVYAPQHYAGLAALRQGNCAAALRYWGQSANAAFVNANPALASVEQQGRGDCGSAVASQSKPPVAVPAPAPPPASTVATQQPPAKPPLATPAPAPAPSRPVLQTPVVSAPIAAPPPVVEQRPAPSAAAEALRPLLEAYLGGRYAEVLRLSARPGGDARVRWHMYTLRAAAAFQLVQLGGEPADAESIARQAVSDARAAEASRKPDATFYSPKFVAFYSAP